MSPKTLSFKLLLAFIQAVLIQSNLHNVKADFSDSCVNSTTSTSCIRTYEQLYNSLAKSENSFNIESALYPAKRPSSVLVRVSIYDHTNKTLHAEYLWSMSCLYAAIPATLLEVLSLGSIIVASRTQDLKIQIPYFCCNVSDKESDRRTNITGMIEGVLAALQDLAVSPGIRDPRLNTAECVIEGHKTNITATGRNSFITIILWSPVGFTSVSCFLLAYIFEHYRKLAKEDTNNGALQESEEERKRRERKEKEDKSFAQAVCYLCRFLAVIGGSILLAAFIISIVYCCRGELRSDVPFIFLLIFFEISGVFYWRKRYLQDEWSSLPLTICASVTSYLASWLLIGVMINPTWGLTVTLLLVFCWAAITFARYKYLNAPDDQKRQSGFSCVFFVLAVIFLVLVVVMAGQGYYGRETADETLKTALLSVIGALLSWLSWKKHLSVGPAGDSFKRNDSNHNLEMNSLVANQ